MKDKKGIPDCLLTRIERMYADHEGQKWGETGISHLCAYEKDGHKFSILWEFNRNYGDICRQWVIDGNMFTGVKCKHNRKWNLIYDCSNALIGEREIEKGSMAYEFLFKPLGIPCGDIFEEKERGPSKLVPKSLFEQWRVPYSHNWKVTKWTEDDT